MVVSATGTLAIDVEENYYVRTGLNPSLRHAIGYAPISDSLRAVAALVSSPIFVSQSGQDLFLIPFGVTPTLVPTNAAINTFYLSFI